jgi:hypothetical protein
MKLLLEGLLMALMLISELVGLVALAKYTETTTETPSPRTESFAIVASDDGEGYQWVEWDASCEVWGVQRESESSVEANFSESAAEDCGVHIRPYLATTTRQPGVVRSAGGHRAEPTSENASSSRHLGE